MRVTYYNCHFSDRRVSYAERTNNNRNIVHLVACDIIVAQTAVQSDASKNKVGPLSSIYVVPFVLFNILNEALTLLGMYINRIA